MMRSLTLFALVAGASALSSAQFAKQKQHLDKQLEMLNKNLAAFQKQDLKDPEVYELYKTTRGAVKHATAKLKQHQKQFPEAPTDWKNDDDEQDQFPEAPSDWKNDDDEPAAEDNSKAVPFKEQKAEVNKVSSLLETKAAPEGQVKVAQAEKSLKNMRLKAYQARRKADDAQKKAEAAATKVEAAKQARQQRIKAIKDAMNEAENPHEKTIEVIQKAIEEAKEDQEDLNREVNMEVQPADETTARKLSFKSDSKKKSSKSAYRLEAQRRKVEAARQANQLLMDEGKGTYGRFADMIIGNEAVPETPEAYHKRTHPASLLQVEIPKRFQSFQEIPKVTLTLEETIAKREKELRGEALLHKKAVETAQKALYLCGVDKGCVNRVEKKLKSGVFDRELAQQVPVVAPKDAKITKGTNDSKTRELHKKKF